jgi:hypothetical protein
MHAFEMPRQQRFHAIIAKVAGLDDGHWSQDIPACACDVRAEELLSTGREGAATCRSPGIGNQSCFIPR